MLRINPTKRYSIKQILKDEWYNRPNALMTDGKYSTLQGRIGQCLSNVLTWPSQQLGHVNDPVQLASLLMENVNDASNCSPV
jgi:serine/threonine-protein kinase Chk1